MVLPEVLPKSGSLGEAKSKIGSDRGISVIFRPVGSKPTPSAPADQKPESIKWPQ